MVRVTGILSEEAGDQRFVVSQQLELLTLKEVTELFNGQVAWEQFLVIC